jgi:hypothetical protein
MKPQELGAKHSERCILVIAIMAFALGMIAPGAQAEALDAPETGELTETPMGTFLLLAVLVLIWLMAAVLLIVRIRRGAL